MSEVAALDAVLVLIGNGSPAQALAFVREHQLELPGLVVLTDPSLETYRAAGLLRSLFATAGPRSLFDLGRALAHGYVQTGVFGDRLQQGGTLILDRSSEVVLHHLNRSLGGHLKAERLVAALALASGRRG